jgi:tetratricopeptide (TPR) repeat protein
MHRYASLLLLLTLIAGPAAAMTPAEIFADGNRLFRDDLYFAALLRYEQAYDAGLDTPALHYNTGVAHYKALQFRRAREALLRAERYPEFAIPARYNLGLTAYAAGDREEALRWFRLVRDQDTNRRLAKYAEIAIARLETVEVIELEEFTERAATVKQTRRFSNFELRTRVGFGTDSNPFRTPGENYVDLADPDLPIVTPEVQSGAFVPVSLSAKYQVNALENEGFFVAYRFGGRFFQDENLKDANEYRQEGSFGSNFRKREDGVTREVYSAFTFAQSDETFYDPDDGGRVIVDGVDIQDRMNYTRYGPEITLRRTGPRWGVGFAAKGQLWDYEDIEVIPSYDHEYFLLGGRLQYRFSRTSLIRVVADGYSRRFSDRPSFDLDGNQFITNPPLRYDFLDLGVLARQRVTDSMWFGVDFTRTERADKFQGYNDYTRDAFGFEFHWSPHYRFDLEASGEYRLFDYPNAFAFNEPIGGPKTREDIRGSFIASYRMTGSLSLVAEAHLVEVASNDTRLAYARNRFALSVRWEP